MECHDERAKQLLYSFDGLQDPEDDEYLRRHLTTCVSCHRRREAFSHLDGMFHESLRDFANEHIDNEKLDLYLTGPSGLSEVDVTEIKLHLEVCGECKSVSEILLKCNHEIGNGLWDEPPLLSKSQEEEFRRTDQERRDRLREVLVGGGKTRRFRELSYARIKLLLARLINYRRLGWAVLVLAAFASVAIYLWTTTRIGEDQTRSPGSQIRLLSPGNDEALATPYVFRWERDDDAVRYDLIIKDIERPDEPVIRVSNLSEPVYELKESEFLKLKPGRLYQWEVSGTTGSRRTISSTIRVFRAPPG